MGSSSVRRAIQNSQESLRTQASRYGINQKTVAKWTKRTAVADLPARPRDPRSKRLSLYNEAIILAFLNNKLLPTAYCRIVLYPTIRTLTTPTHPHNH